MYINHRQDNWLEWLATEEFAFNNKVYTKVYIPTKSLSFEVNYEREPRIDLEIRKREICKSRGVRKENKENV